MQVNDFLGLCIQVMFVLLGFITTLDYIRHRDVTRRDIALMFYALALPFFIQILVRVGGIQQKWLDVVGSAALFSQPYLLLRLLQYFRPIPRLLMRTASIGMIVSWLAFALAPILSPISTLIAGIAVILYFAVIDGYAMLAFIQGALTTSGVVRQRLRFAAAGSGLLALALLGLIFAVLLPPLQNLIILLILLCAIAAALSYYVGFAPPRWLRRAWQLVEFRTFLIRINSKSTGERLDMIEILGELCHSANFAVGGMTAIVIQWNETDARWISRYSSTHQHNPFTKQPYKENNTVKQAWQGASSAFIRISDSLKEDDRILLETMGAHTLLIAPISISEKMWGLLLVFLESSSLFIEDDLDFIVLLAQQSAIFLENNMLIQELHHHSEQLEKRVEERTRELRESEAEYQRIVETAQEGIWVLDGDNKTTFVNARMAEMLGYTVEEILEKPTLTFLDEANRAEALARRKSRYLGLAEQYELKFLRKDGSDLWTLISTSPFLDEEKHYIGALFMVADITQRKQSEEAILKLNAELEERVAVRTAQLEAVNRELEAFSYSVSHDLRAPLRSLDGFSLALLEDYSDHLNDDGKKYLQRIRAGSQRMGQLIDAMLQLSRVSRVELQIEPVNLSDLVRIIETDLRDQYDHVPIECLVTDDLVVQGDERLLRIALTNLLSNAWKFTSKQSHPRVEFGVTDHQGHPAYFVRDNGVGFDMAYANKLFGAFQRLHNVNDYDGTGIGLATVERIMRLHGGRAWADAKTNVGATFYFMLNSEKLGHR